ncbi:UNVERIFIED_CONTAM: Mitogen-activated protein kinase kinase kinase [Sesamum calycinum]|uniref:Mitogen-activated protein kinase kinase kinase n=2 Tax=Sesamum TaxID=4181 RepID=A0AAW2MQ76_9LAMI
MDWVRGEKLGQGSFATVSLAVPRGRSSFLPPLMAVKSCGVSNSSSLVNERLVLEELRDCPEIIRCFGESSSYENGEKLYNVLLEYASGGSLADKLKKSGDRRLPESDVRQYTKSLLKGLRYIHKVGFVHCDIKLQNILLGPNGGVKIADFGLAKRVGRKSAVPRCELRGTPMYMSPEMVGAGEQGAPADIWALGCVVAEMVAGAPAWSCSDVAGLLMRIGVGEEVPAIPGILSEEGKDFLGKCFVKNPSKRWTAEMLLNHPFVCDRDLDDAALKDRVENTASTSPRCPFDFPDWVSSATCSITSLPSPAQFPESGLWFCEESNFRKESWSISPAERLQGLVSEQGPHWSVSDDWVTIR